MNPSTNKQTSKQSAKKNIPWISEYGAANNKNVSTGVCELLSELLVIFFLSMRTAVWNLWPSEWQTLTFFTPDDTFFENKS